MKQIYKMICGGITVKLQLNKILVTSFILSFFLLIAAQAVLTNQEVWEILSVNNELEGKPLGAEESLYKEGKIFLTADDEEYCIGLKVLVNGAESVVFQSNTVEIAVRDKDVIEIDASNNNHTITVTVTDKSGNVNEDCLNKKIIVASGVHKLVRIRIK